MAALFSNLSRMPLDSVLSMTVAEVELWTEDFLKVREALGS